LPDFYHNASFADMSIQRGDFFIMFDSNYVSVTAQITGDSYNVSVK
jgi:hypothetical protein